MPQLNASSAGLHGRSLICLSLHSSHGSVRSSASVNLLDCSRIFKEFREFLRVVLPFRDFDHFPHCVRVLQFIAETLRKLFRPRTNALASGSCTWSAALYNAKFSDDELYDTTGGGRTTDASAGLTNVFSSAVLFTP